MKTLALAACAAMALSLAPAADPQDYKEFRIDDDPHLRYRIIGPKKLIPEGGYRLVVILPGGDGSDQFTGWCNAIYQNAIPDDFVAVQLIAPQWSDGQARSVTWPTKRSPADGMEMPVEDFFDRVVEAVGEKHPLAKGEVYTFSWSSGGVPAYLIAAEGRSEIRGSFVAMAVFRSQWVPEDLAKVRGQRFFLYQSPDDEVTPLDSAEGAKATLEENGAAVQLKNYDGGHGWTQGAGHFGDIRDAFAWLVEE